nr:protein FAR1-related sequence 5-like [Tanacetum cinerariifolium]
MVKRNLPKPLLEDEEFEANKKDIETLDAKKPSKKKRGLTVHISFQELRYVNMFRKDVDHDRYKECTYVVLEGMSLKNQKLEVNIQQLTNALKCMQRLPKGVNKDTMSEETSENKIRTGSIIRTGCLARAKFKINVTHTGYVLYEFEEAQNHTFVPKAYRNLTKKRKQMSHPEQISVQQLGSTSIGATRAHHLYASTHGGYESVNATATEYPNHKKDLNAHIGEGDAQMLITMLTNRKLHVDNFSFEYIVENSQLSALFWADEMSKYNYKEFGDTISFDATFRTNK